MRRVGVRLKVSLMVGVVVTVLVSWSLPRGAKLYSPHPRGQFRPWPIRVSSAAPNKPDETRFWNFLAETEIHYLAFSNKNEDWVTCYVIEYRSGWPFRALVRYKAMADSGNISLSGAPILSEVGISMSHKGFTVPPLWLLGGWSIDRPLPLKPLWAGFIADSMLFGSIPCLLWMGVVMLKRRRRVKRGLCTQCAYPIAGLKICPECGTATPSTIANATSASKSDVMPLEPPPSPPG